MTTFCDEIVAGIVTLFKYFMQGNIYENQTDFHYINDYSKCCQGNSFYKIYLIWKIYCSEQLEASSQAKKNTTTYTFLYTVSQICLYYVENDLNLLFDLEKMAAFLIFFNLQCNV